MPKTHNFAPSRRSTILSLAGLLSCEIGPMGKALAASPIAGPLPDTASKGLQVWGVDHLGYIAEEFLLSGNANVFEEVTMSDSKDMSKRDNVKDLARRDSYERPILRGNVPYTTRLTVYRPKDKSRFSGNVILEITHPEESGAQVVWRGSSGFFAAHGDAYIAVQHPVNFPALRYADPGRYGALAAADPTQIWGMVSDAAKLVKTAGSGSPLIGYRVQHLYLTGYSYTGVATATFANFHHDGTRLPSGNPVFSGYLPLANATYVRPLDVPVLRINTQSDFNSFGGVNNRGQDSDDPQSRYRLYEVTGTSHVNASPTVLPAASAPKPVPISQRPTGLPNNNRAACLAAFPAGSQPNNAPLNYVIACGFENMYEWVSRNIAPPHSPLIETTEKGAASLDGNGNAKGGLRLPQLDVPADTYGIGEGGCLLLGYRLPFSAEKMKALYGSSGKYVEAFSQAATSMVDKRLIRRIDLDALVGTAEKSPF